MTLCNFNNEMLTCPVCGFRAMIVNTRRVCRSIYPQPEPQPPKPTIDGGPGTELKRLLATMGIHSTDSCPCNARARIMDEREAGEPGWCAANLDEIVGWLREEATRRRLPFIETGARLLVKRAIANAKKKRH